jgi:hypothetical protein
MQGEKETSHTFRFEKLEKRKNLGDQGIRQDARAVGVN